MNGPLKQRCRAALLRKRVVASLFVQHARLCRAVDLVAVPIFLSECLSSSGPRHENLL